MRRKRHSICSLVVALLATLPALSARAAVGDTFALQGRLVSAAGFPIPDGDYGLTVSFYKDAADPQPMYAYLEPGVKVHKGLFVLTLGSKTKLDKTPFLSGDAAWFGVQVGSDPEMPRLPLHQVPYALRAQMALALQCTGCITGDMLDASVLKDYAKIGSLAAVATSGAFTDLKGLPVLIAADQKCAAGTLVAGLGADGKVVCVTAPTYGGKDFALAGQACGAGLHQTGIDVEGKPVCALPVQAGLACQLGQVVTGFDAAGKPVCGAGVQAGQSCAAGQVVTGFNAAGVPVCAADKVNVYGGKDFALANQACAAGQMVIGVDADGKAVCAADANSTYNGKDFALANQACPAGQVVTGVDANGKAVCAAGGTLTAVTASAPLASSGGATPNLTLAQATASVNGFLAAGDWTTFASKVASVAATSGGGLLAGGTASAPTLGLTNACGAGQILKWSGSAWACAADNDTNSGGTVTSVGGSAPIASSGGATPVLSIAQASASASGYLAASDWTSFASKVTSIAATTGGGLLAGGTASAPTLGLTNACGANQILKWSGSAWSCAADNDTNSGGTVTSVGATAGGGLVAAGTATAPTVGLVNSCTSGQMLKWNGSAWACAADNDTNSGGTVTGVTATGPLASSGGATPNLTLAQATGSAAGFLAAADWTAFNSKVASLAATAGGGLVAAGTATAPTIGLTTSCGVGQMLKWNGSAWGCGADNDTNSGGTVTNVTATGPLASSGGATPNLTLVQASASAAGFVAAADWNAFNSKLASLAATAGGGLAIGGSATAPTVGLTTACATGEILKWNGSAWACAADGDTSKANIVSTEFTNVAKITSTTFVDVPGFSATITPSSTSSRILVMANVVAGMNGATTGGYKIIRGASPIAVPPAVGGYVSLSSASFYSGSGDANNNEEASVTYLDSPASAGPVTYKIQVAAPQGTTIVVNGLGSDTASQTWSQRARSSLTLIEMR